MFSYAYSHCIGIRSRVKLCTQAHLHLAGRLLHCIPSRGILFPGAVLIGGVRLPLYFGKCQAPLLPWLPACCQSHFQAFPSLGIYFLFLSVEKEFQEKYQKPHSQYYISVPFFLSQSPKQVAEVGDGGSKGWEAGWESDCDGGWVSAVLLWKLE